MLELNAVVVRAVRRIWVDADRLVSAGAQHRHVAPDRPAAEVDHRCRAVGADPRDPRVVWATGHFRNGILLCPATADLVADVLTGGTVDSAFAPDRFGVAA